MADTRLYDILGVSPNANDTEIKKVSWLFFEGLSNLWGFLMYLCGFVPLTWQNFLVLQEAGERVSP